MSDLFYFDENGHQVHTTQYLKNRGSCCRSFCLHCPYGTTLKKYGLQFKEIGDQLQQAKSILPQATETQDVAQSLLSQAFGSPKKQLLINEGNKDQFRFIMLKEKVSGLAHISMGQVKEIYLKSVFSEQGIDQDTVQAYFLEQNTEN